MTQQNTLSSEQAVSAYIKILKGEEEKYNDVVAKCERKLSILRQRLNDPEKWLNREIKEGSLRARAVLGQELPAKKSNLPKKSEVAAPPAPAREEKQKTGFGFFKV